MAMVRHVIGNESAIVRFRNARNPLSSSCLKHTVGASRCSQSAFGQRAAKTFLTCTPTT